MHPHIALALFVASAALACDPRATGSPVPPPTHEEIAAARVAWDDVYDVLTHPRCMNCHPDGDAPLQTDASTPHRWGIDRDAIERGLECSSCHQAGNTPGGPPGAPTWHFPSAETPMIFQGRDSPTLCAQLNDPRATGGRDLDALLTHVATEPLVQWAWDPGDDRTTPPMTRDAFLDAFAIWVQGDGACPDETEDAMPSDDIEAIGDAMPE